MKVLIVGGSKGMGLGIAQRCMREGHQVVTLQRGIPEDTSVQSLHMDLGWSQPALHAATMAGIEQLGGKLDWLILAGGMGAYMGYLDHTPDKAKNLMQVNYHGPRGIFHAAAKFLKRRRRKTHCPECMESTYKTCWRCKGTRDIEVFPEGYSRVLWLGSTVCDPPGASGLEDYAATKGAVRGLFTSLSRHYLKWGILQTLYSTSWVDTPMTQAIRDQAPELYAKILKFCPLGRMATVAETSEAMYHLLSGPEYYHGTEIRMTGGGN